MRTAFLTLLTRSLVGERTLLAMKDSFALEQRQLERISLPRPILIRSDVLGYADSTAVLRDISAVGAYCYTLMPLTKGDVVELFLTLSDDIGAGERLTEMEDA
jgi:hypothetical protein